MKMTTGKLTAAELIKASAYRAESKRYPEDDLHRERKPDVEALRELWSRAAHKQSRNSE